jgi:ParB/RepB/Spo0J family partition protein
MVMSEAENSQLPWDEGSGGPPLPLPDRATSDSGGEPDEAPLSLPDKPLLAPAAQLVDIDQIHQLDNSRSSLGDINSLSENIRVRGLLHPVVLRPAQDASHGCAYELIAGYRRLAAFEYLERIQIPAVIHDATDEDVLAELVSENQERENPTAPDEARTMQRMIDVFGWSHRQVAAHLGVDKSQVTKRLGMLKLPETIQEMVSEGKLTASHAEVIARLDSPESQQELADLAVKTGSSVAKLNGYASKIKERDDEKIEPDDPETKSADPDQPLDTLTSADVVPLTRMIVKADLPAAELARANLYVLLRGANDQEMLDTLQEKFGVAFAQLWEWVEVLDDAQVTELTETMLRRWLGAAHRYPTFPEALKSRFGEGLGELTDRERLILPEGIDLDGPDDDEDWSWDDEFGDDPDVF